MKIIEIEDEAEKWQKEKDRIKVSSLRLPSCALTRLCAWEKADLCCYSRPWPTVILTLPLTRFNVPTYFPSHPGSGI